MESTFYGEYDLVTVDGLRVPLPAFVYQDSAGFIVERVLLSGSIQLHRDGWYQRTGYRMAQYDPVTMEPIFQDSTFTVSGTGFWGYSGWTLNFRRDYGSWCCDSTTGTLSRGHLTIGTWVYRKR